MLIFLACSPEVESGLPVQLIDPLSVCLVDVLEYLAATTPESAVRQSAGHLLDAFGRRADDHGTTPTVVEQVIVSPVVQCTAELDERQTRRVVSELMAATREEAKGR